MYPNKLFFLLSRNYAVFAVQPKRMERQCYSCYDNFVESDETGAPLHDLKNQCKAVQHLQGILEELDQRKSL